MAIDTIQHGGAAEHFDLGSESATHHIDSFALRSALAQTFPDYSDALRYQDTILRLQYAPEDEPVLVVHGSDIIVGQRSALLNPTSVSAYLDETLDSGYPARFSVELTNALSLPYDKQRSEVDITACDIVEVQFAGASEDGVMKADVYIGLKEIIACPALEFEADRNAIFRHIGITHK